MTSTPPSSHHSQSGKTTPFLGSPASSRNGDHQTVGAQQQQQQQPADSFGGDWSVWGSTLAQVDLKPQQDRANASSSQDAGRSTDGIARSSTGRFDPNAPPFLYTPTYTPQQLNQDGSTSAGVGGPTFAPYAMQAPMGDSYNPYEHGAGGPTSPYSPAASSFGPLPSSPVMPLGQMAYGSFDGSNSGFWMMGSPAPSAATLPGGQDFDPSGRRQSRDGGVQYARGYADPPPFSSGYGAQQAYGAAPAGPAVGLRSPSFAYGQQRRLSHSGWPQFNNSGMNGGYPSGARRNHSLGARAGYRMNGQQQPGGAFGSFQPGNGGGHLGLKRGSTDGGFAPVARSAMLDNFRSDKTRLWELSEIKGHVVEFTADQFASRWLQQKLETASEEDRQWIFDEVLPSAFAIQTDVFGNYCCQKLFDYGTPEQREALAKTMEGYVLPLSLSTYGCRSIQKALEVVTSEQRNVLVAELKDNIMDCVKSSNANHVIQRIVALPEPGLDFIAAFTGRVFELATHPYGCRVLQRCFEFLPEPTVRPLLTEMHTHTRRLVLDSFGNYVIQFVIEKGLPEDRTRIIAEMKTQIFQMARHKFASNVCEKALVCAPREEREMLIDELLIKPEGSVALLMKDQYGNYVIQRSLRVSEGAQKEALKARVRPHLEQMRLSAVQPHSKHLASIERLLADEPEPNEEISPEVDASISIVPPVIAELAAVAGASSATSSAPMSRADSAASLPPSLAPSLSSGASSPVPTPSQSSEQHAVSPKDQAKN